MGYRPNLENCPKCHGEVYMNGRNILGYIRIKCTRCEKQYTLRGCKDEARAPKRWKTMFGSGYYDN